MKLLVLLLAACGASPDPADTSSSDSASPTDSVSDTPTGDSLEDAVPIQGDKGRTTTADAIDPEGDMDYWSVELAQGEYLQARIVTVEGDIDDPDFDCDGTFDANPLDTVLTVYDPSGAEVVVADDQPVEGCGRDSLALAHATTAGTWTVAVTDWNNWEFGGAAFGNPPVGGAEYSYTLYTTIGTADSADLPDYGTVGELISSNELVFSVPTRTWMTIYHPTGTNAGTDDSVFSLADGDGALLASVDDDSFYGTVWALGVRIPLDPGDYVFSLSDTDGMDAPDDWWWLVTESDEESAIGQEIEPNDDVASATPMALLDGEGQYEGEYLRAFGDGDLEAGGVDDFALSVLEGQYVYLTAYGPQVGSLLDPVVTLTDVDGTTVLDTADADSANIQGERPSADGDLLIEVTGADAETSGYYLLLVEVWDEARPW